MGCLLALFSAFEVWSKQQSRPRDHLLYLQISNIGPSQLLSSALAFCGCMYFLFKKRTIAVPGLSHFLQIKSSSSSFLCRVLLCIGEHSLPSHPAQKRSATYKADLQTWGNKMKDLKTTPMMTVHGIFFPPYLDLYPPYSICTFQLFQNNEQTFLQLHKSGTFHFPCRLRDTHKLFGINSKNTVHFVKLYSKHPVIFHWKH